MRFMRVITGVVLIAALALLLLAIGSYGTGILRDQAAASTGAALSAQARLSAEYAEVSDQPPAAVARWLSALTGARVVLFDGKATLLADSAGASARPSSRELYVSPFAGERRVADLLCASAALEDGTTIVIAAPPAPITAAQERLSRALIATFVLMTILVLAAASRGWGSLDVALDRMEVALRRLRDGDLSARAHEIPRSPVRGLTSSVNEALDHLTALLAAARGRSRYYGTILDQMTDAVVATDERGHVRFINRSFTRLIGTEPGEAEGRPLESVTLNYDLSALVTRAVQQGTVQRAELRLTHPHQRFLEAAATPLRDEDDRPIGAVALLHDLTPLREADQIRVDFVANAGHELRTPAAGIKALAEALLGGALRDPQHGPQFLEQIVAAADRLAAILDDMLTLARVERGAQLLQPSNVNVRTALDDAANMVRPRAMQKSVPVTVEADEGDAVYADEPSLRTLLLNLLDNAVKYTPAGGSVTAHGRAVGGGYELSVTDTGVGIPEEHLERIFERFYRVDRARDRATGGTGLGLSIVKHIAEAHGGSVHVRSREGEGSTFTAFLPDAQYHRPPQDLPQP